LAGLTSTPNRIRHHGIAVKLDGVRRSAHDLLAYPGVDLERLKILWPEIGAVAPEIAEQMEIEGRYASYLRRQEADVQAFRKDEALLLPGDLDYRIVAGLSTEARSKLDQARPATLGAAARISGVTPAALSILLAHVRRDSRPNA
jgi:tRNA uridine 5-carboxymethylaminomethyl modification enzyme